MRLTITLLLFVFSIDCQSQNIKAGNSFLIIETPPSGPENDYEFCNDGTVWISYGFDGQSHGKWHISNDTIYFTDLIFHYKIGVDDYKLAGDHAWYNHYIGQTFLKPIEKFVSINQIKNPRWFEIKEMNCDNQKEKYYNSLSEIFPGNYGFASYKPLNNNDLKNYDSKTLRLIRNEIFARYGYSFKSKELQQYFETQSWYKPEYGSYDTLLTEIEKNNIELLIQLEKN